MPSSSGGGVCGAVEVTVRIQCRESTVTSESRSPRGYGAKRLQVTVLCEKMAGYAIWPYIYHPSISYRVFPNITVTL